MPLQDLKGRMILLNTKWRDHTLLAFCLGLWLTFFLILISPFDTSDLTLKAKFMILPIYGLIVFLIYMVVLFFQSWLYKRDRLWTMKREILILLFFYLSIPIFSYWYYQTDIVNGTDDFLTFLFFQYVPIAIIISPLIIYGRIYLNRRHRKNSKNKVVLSGDNKGDLLQVNPNDILCISSAQNYVEVHYLQKDQIKKQLLRTTLKSVSSELDHLTQVHRSYLINPAHFTKWKDTSTVYIQDIEVPVSKKYKGDLDRVIQSSL